jgi:SAM-dependent methyltransferase
MFAGIGYAARPNMSKIHEQSRRFGFGQNWLDFAQGLNADRIAEAERSLRRLLQSETLTGLGFLDVGSGSGLFSLAARRLGARVHSFDSDAASVLCTRRVRELHRPHDRDWNVEQGSILDPDYVNGLGKFDIVYSWGVLHHTGAMQQALQAAASLVAAQGLFAVALYHRTLMCGLWRREKRWYAGASPHAQHRARTIYIALLRAAFFVTRRDFRSYVENYQSNRGMDFLHDVHDWMGGYPYESILAPEVEALLRPLGFARVHGMDSTLTTGLFGSGCDEYLYRRTD